MMEKLDRIAFGLFVLAAVSATFSEILSAVLMVGAGCVTVVYFKTR